MVKLGGFIKPFLKSMDAFVKLRAKVSANLACCKLNEEVPKLLLDAGRNFLKKEILSEGSEISLTNNEIKDIIKAIRSLENRRVLLKGTTRKITTQEGGFLNFLKRFMSVGLSLMKNVLTPF